MSKTSSKVNSFFLYCWFQTKPVLLAFLLTRCHTVPIYEIRRKSEIHLAAFKLIWGFITVYM